jgi:hypothetical protein
LKTTPLQSCIELLAILRVGKKGLLKREGYTFVVTGKSIVN